MGQQELNNLQKKDLFDALLEVGINPSEASFENLNNGSKVALAFKVYSGKCEFYHHNNVWSVSFTPAIGRPSNAFQHGPVWDGKLVSTVKDWLKYMHDLESTPDPWKTTISMPLPKVAEISSVRNTVLNVLEYEKVSSGLLEIKKLFLEAAKLSNENQKEISERLDKVVEDGKTLGRKDFFNHIVAAIISLALTCVLPNDVVKAGFEILKQSMNGIIEIAVYEANKLGK